MDLYKFSCSILVTRSQKHALNELQSFIATINYSPISPMKGTALYH